MESTRQIWMRLKRIGVSFYRYQYHGRYQGNVWILYQPIPWRAGSTIGGFVPGVFVYWREESEVPNTTPREDRKAWTRDVFLGFETFRATANYDPAVVREILGTVERHVFDICL